jgi:hypothetical protein
MCIGDIGSCTANYHYTKPQTRVYPPMALGTELIVGGLKTTNTLGVGRISDRGWTDIELENTRNFAFSRTDEWCPRHVSDYESIIQ